MLGVDWDNSPLNLEAKIRKKMGLPAFDRWDDYRIDRMLANMAADGEYPVSEIKRAMIEREGPIFDEAKRRADKEFAISAIGSTLGIPAKAYPVGEKKQRALQTEFQRAYAAYEGGDVDALTTFFEKHPEYEVRLALWKEPEERLRNFLIDEIWDRYHDMPNLHMNQLRETFGELWEQFFLDKESRNYDAVTLDTLQLWLRAMGGDPPGKINKDAIPLELAPPEIAWTLQVFYDMRKDLFDWDELRKTQEEYFKLKKGSARRNFLVKHPELKDYWDWRRDFLHRNPEVVSYYDEDFEFQYPTEEALRSALAPGPLFTWTEWQYVLPLSIQAALLSGDPLPPTDRKRLERIAEILGVTPEFIIEQVEMLTPQ
jgi:hypothetical protein